MNGPEGTLLLIVVDDRLVGASGRDKFAIVTFQRLHTDRITICATTYDVRVGGLRLVALDVSTRTWQGSHVSIAGFTSSSHLKLV